MDIAVATERDAAEWDRIVEESPHGTIFHTWKWLKIVEKYTGSRLYPVIGYDRNEPAAIIPLFLMKKMQIRMVFSPPPQTALFYLGPLLIDYEMKKQHKREAAFEIFQKAIDSFLIDDLKANYISIALPPGIHDPRAYAWAGYTVEPAYDYIQDISKGIEYAWQMIPRKVRQNINRASSRGISVVEGSRRDFERVIDLMNKRYEEQGKLVTVPKDYLFDLYEQYPGNIKVFAAQYDEEVISGVISIFYRNQVLSWIGNPKISIPDLPSPNDKLIWEEIKCGCIHGMKQYVTLSAAGNERLHAYYSSKMNPELQIRFTAGKHTLAAGIMEKTYTRILKPMKERFH